MLGRIERLSTVMNLPLIRSFIMAFGGWPEYRVGGFRESDKTSDFADFNPLRLQQLRWAIARLAAASAHKFHRPDVGFRSFITPRSTMTLADKTSGHRAKQHWMCESIWVSFLFSLLLSPREQTLKLIVSRWKMSRRSEAKAERRKPQAKDEIYFYCCCEISGNIRIICYCRWSNFTFHKRSTIVCRSPSRLFFPLFRMLYGRMCAMAVYGKQFLDEAPRQFFVA
jgi:hypothetical protein